MSGGVRTIGDLKARCHVEDGADGCWIWRMASDNRGTPKLWLPAKQAVCTGQFASLFLVGRPPVEGQKAYRLCATPNCLRPAHLAAMTEQEFGARVTESGVLKRDVRRAAKLRAASRSRKTCKVNAAIAEQIRQAEGTLKEIGARYGIGHSQVSKIRRGESWAQEMPCSSVFSWAANSDRQAA